MQPARGEEILALLVGGAAKGIQGLVGVHGQEKINQQKGDSAVAGSQGVAVLFAVGCLICRWPVAAIQEAHGLALLAGSAARRRGRDSLLEGSPAMDLLVSRKGCWLS